MKGHRKWLVRACAIIAAVVGLCVAMYSGRRHDHEECSMSAATSAIEAESGLPYERPPTDVGTVGDRRASGGGVSVSKAPEESEWRPYSNQRPPNVPEGEAYVPGRKKIHKVNRFVYNPNAIHRNRTEQALLDIFTCEIGDRPKPLAALSQEERARIVEILTTPNRIDKDDDESTALSKEILQTAKEEMHKYVVDGGDPDEFLSYYWNQLRQAADKRFMATEQIYEIIENENDPSLAKALMSRVNDKLRAEGIKPVPIPSIMFE